MNPTDPKSFKFLIPLMILDAFLRGLAMWRSARSGKKWWFIALFMVNTLGILPAVYLFLNRSKSTPPPAPSEVIPSATPKLIAHKKRSSK